MGIKQTNQQRRDRGLAYLADETIFEEQKACRKILQKLNFMDRSDFDGIQAVVQELFGKSDSAFVNPPFYCDYGKHIETGKNFFANYNCTLLDVAKIKIGDNCQLAPNVAIYTKDIPDWYLAAGNPCRLIRKITWEDRRNLFHEEEIDEEAWQDIIEHMEFGQ